MNATALMSYENWERAFEPITSPPIGGELRVYELDGRDDALVTGMNFANPDRVWSLVEDESGLRIEAGYGRRNCIGHVLSERPAGFRQGGAMAPESVRAGLLQA